MRELRAGKNDAGLRLDRFIGKAVPLLPDSLVQKYIRIKRIKLNGARAARDAKLSEGDLISLYVNDEFFERPAQERAYLSIPEPRLDIVYEDENILLVCKEPGVLCHSAGGWSAGTLLARIQARSYQLGDWRPDSENSFAPALCNRIDRNTGGLVIAAKNAEALRVINEKIKSREIDKYYLCAVSGEMDPPEGTLSGYIFKDAKQNRVYVRQSPCPGAKTAVTRYRTLERRDGLSLLECRLETGRTHQIRAQLAAAGRPLVGDGKYGRADKRRDGDEPGQFLWSYKLRFSFKTPAGPLQYLGGKTFLTGKAPFVERLFKFNSFR